ncbi:phage antirepressor KilAC domain-containing protein [Pseudomonas indica]|uniref:Phage antirepressor protein KilAC domain-containing protein n=1 Tax=Pseudomonas indica TaxID=137658 RepID=A0A1G8V2J9_9PSED|nr:phage antirepressor KilAC domain-containing protein [Pseudomonas indica]SDJ60278.1 Phage antirepressor protein KilAC domain-containing protein [Pseudomonas indica]
MHLDLQKAAKRLGLTRPKLIERMQAKGLLDSNNLPAHPVRDRAYLRIREGQWFHPQCGMQYSRSCKVTEAGVRWLAEQLGIDLPMPPPTPDRRDVA